MAIDSDRIRKPVRELRKFLKKSPKRPSSDQIHDLRTNARRVETAVDALGVRSHKNEQRLLRDLAKVRKRAGKVRDMDVLTGDALTVNLNGEQDCLVQLLETLGTNRTRHVKKLRVLIATRGPQLRSRLKRTASKLQNLLGQAPDRKSGSVPDAPAEAMAKALRLAEELKYPPRLDKENLHPYRIKVKELRYILQLADNADQQEFVKKLGEVKDAIGEWHDWEELIAIASDVLDHGAKCKLLPKLRAISETKYLKALSLTNHMRHTYLDFSVRRRSRRRTRKLATVRPPVLAATSAIAA